MVYGAVIGKGRDIALPDQPAGLRDDSDFLTQAFHGLQHMAGDEDGAALLGEAAQPLLHGSDSGGIDAFKGFVQKENFRGMDDCGSEGHAFAHARAVFREHLGGIGQLQGIQ